VLAGKQKSLFRLVLGLAQMFGAAMGLALLLFSGVNALSLTVAAITGILTTVSIMLFGGNRAK
jgi:hypothetical protein